MEEITIISLLQELQSFIPIPKDILSLAEKSNITYSNTSAFSDEVELWKAGSYDEDPEILLSELSLLLKK